MTATIKAAKINRTIISVSFRIIVLSNNFRTPQKIFRTLGNFRTVVKPGGLNHPAFPQYRLQIVGFLFQWLFYKGRAVSKELLTKFSIGHLRSCKASHQEYLAISSAVNVAKNKFRTATKSIP